MYLSHFLPPRSLLGLTADTDLLKAIKFKNSDGELNPIGEHDVTVANLKSMISSLSRQVEILSSKISASDAKARAAVVANNELSALAALKSKKIAEGSLGSWVKSLGQLEVVLVKIERAADNFYTSRGDGMGALT
jgi:charged multivesicular body protein 7